VSVIRGSTVLTFIFVDTFCALFPSLNDVVESTNEGASVGCLSGCIVSQLESLSKVRELCMLLLFTFS
jgi:hypothetical protein